MKTSRRLVFLFATLFSAPLFAGTLRYSPPKLVDPETVILKSTSLTKPISLSPFKDYILKCDPETNGAITRRDVTVIGGHNIVMKGCAVTRPLNTPKSIYPPLKNADGTFKLVGGKRVCPGVSNPAGLFKIQAFTGVAYIEGLELDMQNTTDAPTNYGVDGIDVGDSNAYATVTLGGKVVAGDHVQLNFKNPRVSTLPESVTVTVQNGDTLSSLAAKLEAAINANKTLSAAGLSARSEDASIVFAHKMPLGFETKIETSLRGAKRESLTFNNPGNAFSAVKYVFQNIRVENVWSTSCGNHADGLQIQSHIGKLYVHNMTVVTGYQGIQLQPQYSILDASLSNVNARYMNPDYAEKNASGDSVGANGYAFWLGVGLKETSCVDCDYNYRLDNVYAERRANVFGKTSQWSLFSISPTRSVTFGNEAVRGGDTEEATFKPMIHFSVTGSVKRGIASTGDFVPRSLIQNPTGAVTYGQ